MGYVECNERGESPENQLKGNYMIDVAGKRHQATPFLKPAYDPTNGNIKIWKALEVKLYGWYSA